jgi:hypothetical protein
MSNGNLTMYLEVAVLLLAAMLVVVLALRVVYADAYKRAPLTVAGETPSDRGEFKDANLAPWLGDGTRRVLIKLEIDNLRKVSRLDAASIQAIEAHLPYGLGRVAREDWVGLAKLALGSKESK